MPLWLVKTARADLIRRSMYVRGWRSWRFCFHSIMFSKPLSALLVLAAIAVASVASVHHHVQDFDYISENFAQNQVPSNLRHLPQLDLEVANARKDMPFDKSSPQSKFEPVGELSAVRSDAWTILRHPIFPRYGVRIKQSHFCDTTVK
jgi:hypothetical protein